MNIDFLIIHLISPLIKIKNNTVLFSSFQGMYNDNPRYISEELHNRCPYVKIKWAMHESASDLPPNYVEVIRKGSIEYYKAVYSSRVVVDNYTGLRSYTIHRRPWYKLLYYRFISRKIRRQLVISTWHGSPIKKIALDEPGIRETSVFLNSADYTISGCQYTSDILSRCFDRKIPVMLYGTPRNDVLVKTLLNVEQLKEHLSIPNDKKVLLFAPTFRNNIALSGAIQMEDLDFSLLCKILNIKFGGDWCIAFRLHNLVLKSFNINDVQQKFPNIVFVNANEHDDMAEYLKVTDVLLTDYSSSMFDFALTGRPCFLYAPDFDDYVSKDRGFYIDINSLPYSIAKTKEELIDDISKFDKDNFAVGINKMLKEMGNVEDGMAASRIVSKIETFLKFGEK